MKRIAITACAVFLSWQCATVAHAQVRSPFGQQTYSGPTVSPFVNLGVNSDGVTNYQTIVRPMMAERDELRRQAATIQQLEQTLRGKQRGNDLRDAKSRGGSQRNDPNVRFMHYSHYFDGR